MKVLVIIAVIAMIAVAGFVVANTQGQETESNDEPITSCSSCGNSCTAENNCGLSSCEAVSGGSCGCQR